jgi:hypothetical protein
MGLGDHPSEPQNRVGLTAKVSIFISVCDNCEETAFLNYFHHRGVCLERMVMKRRQRYEDQVRCVMKLCEDETKLSSTISEESETCYSQTICRQQCNMDKVTPLGYSYDNEGEGF